MIIISGIITGLGILQLLKGNTSNGILLLLTGLVLSPVFGIFS